MDLEFKKKIEERMKELPPALSQAIKNSNWEKLVFDIGREHSLHVDDIGEIQNELILVLTGIVHPDEFRSVLVSELGIGAEKTDAVVSEINTKINERIKAELRKSLDGAEDQESEFTATEHQALRKAGVSFGVEEEEIEDIPAEPEPAPATAPVKAAEVSPTSVSKPSPQAPGVFKTKVTDISAEGKPKNFFDPYREPVE